MRSRYFSMLIGVAGCLTAMQANAGDTSPDQGCSVECQHNVAAVFATHPHYRLTVKPHDGGSVVYVTWSTSQNGRWMDSPVTYKGTVPFRLPNRVVLKDARVPASPGDACHGEIVLEQGHAKTARRDRIEMRNVLCRS